MKGSAGNSNVNLLRIGRVCYLNTNALFAAAER